MGTSEQQNANELATNHFISALQASRIPWRRSWTPEGIPFNPVTKTQYNGINQLLLASLGYAKNFFLTFKQLKELGGSVKPGERGHLAIAWQKGEAEGEKGQLLPYQVFNLDQCADLKEPAPEIEVPDNGYQIAEAIKVGMPEKPKITFSEGEPHYHTATDTVHMPLLKSFKEIDQYYHFLFQELVISTGNEKRLNRKEVTGQFAYDSREYALRQLTAEIGAWQLCSMAGLKIPQPEFGSAYIRYWIDKLQRDKFLIVNATLSAQKAVNYILNISKEQFASSPDVKKTDESDTPSAPSNRKRNDKQGQRVA